MAKISMQIINRKLAIGSPCLHPLPILNLELMFPHMFITQEKLLSSILTQTLTSCPKLKKVKHLFIKEKDTESYAFSKSMSNMRPTFLFTFAQFMIS